MDLKKTGAFLAASRKKQKMTQKELAEEIGVTDKAVSRWETGRGFPDVSVLQPLAPGAGRVGRGNRKGGEDRARKRPGSRRTTRSWKRSAMPGGWAEKRLGP